MTPSSLMHYYTQTAIVTSIIGIFVLGILVHISPVLTADVAITRGIQREGTAALPAAMGFVSFFGIPWVAATSIISASFAFLVFNHRREALFMLSTFAADGATALLKLIVNRPRPNGELVATLQQFSDPSFPSGHVVHYVVFFGFLWIALFSVWNPPKPIKLLIGSAIFALITLVSVSRVYLGVHWTTDVIAGYFVGFVMLFVITRLYHQGRVPSSTQS